MGFLSDHLGQCRGNIFLPKTDSHIDSKYRCNDVRTSVIACEVTFD